MSSADSPPPPEVPPASTPEEAASQAPPASPVTPVNAVSASEQSAGNPPGAEPSASPLVEKIMDALRTVYDPEIPVSIVDLGLIYGVDVLPGGRVVVRMTLTAPSCPEAQSLPIKAESVVAVLPEVEAVRVDVVWDPPWTPARMSDAAKLAAGLL